MYHNGVKGAGAALMVAAALLAGCTGGGGDQQTEQGQQGGQTPTAPAPPPPPANTGTGGGQEQVNEQARQDLRAEFARLLRERPITFEPGSAQLTPQGQQTVTEVSEMITSSPGELRFQLLGYTAPGPSASESPQQLATQRAQTVADQLKQQGVKDAVEAEGVGDAPPNSGPQRRVDIKVP